jgi:hypothetical protein
VDETHDNSDAFNGAGEDSAFGVPLDSPGDVGADEWSALEHDESGELPVRFRGDEPELYLRFNRLLGAKVAHAVVAQREDFEDACAFAWVQFLRHQPDRDIEFARDLVVNRASQEVVRAIVGLARGRGARRVNPPNGGWSGGPAPPILRQAGTPPSEPPATDPAVAGRSIGPRAARPQPAVHPLRMAPRDWSSRRPTPSEPGAVGRRARRRGADAP